MYQHLKDVSYFNVKLRSANNLRETFSHLHHCIAHYIFDLNLIRDCGG